MATENEYPPVPRNAIFVFGSNLAGRHGKGAALQALHEFAAHYGKPYGLQGRSFAIPTKDENLQTLPIEAIQGYANAFVAFARANPQLRFYLTRIGCGLAGYRDEQIAPLFAAAPSNVIRPPRWGRYAAPKPLIDDAPGRAP